MRRPSHRALKEKRERVVPVALSLSEDPGAMENAAAPVERIGDLVVGYMDMEEERGSSRRLTLARLLADTELTCTLLLLNRSRSTPFPPCQQRALGTAWLAEHRIESSQMCRLADGRFRTKQRTPPSSYITYKCGPRLIPSFIYKPTHTRTHTHTPNTHRLADLGYGTLGARGLQLAS